jgi:hypothetical protein
MQANPREEVINHRAARKWSNAGRTPQIQGFRPDDPFPSGRLWTRSGRAHPRSAITSVPTNPRIAGKALCRTRTDDPFLTMEVLYQLS